MYKIYATVIKKKLLAYKMALVAKRRGANYALIFCGVIATCEIFKW
jgi:hypothetical protein